MAGDSRFKFAGTPHLRFTVSVSASGVQILREVRTSKSVQTKSWDIKFTDVARVTKDDWTGSKHRAEGIYLHTRSGETAPLLTFIRVGKDNVTEQDRDTYRSAAAAVLRALARVQPELRVRLGPTPAARYFTVGLFAVFATVLSALYLWQTQGASDEVRFSVVGLIFVMMALQCIYRTRHFKRAVYANIQDVAAEADLAAPRTGPWGAHPPTLESVDA